MRRLFIPLVNCLSNFVQLAINVRVYFWVFNQIPVICIPVLMTVMLQEVLKLKSMIPLTLFCFCKIVLALLGPLTSLVNFAISLSVSASGEFSPFLLI
jgi:hypothetical protein